MASSLTTFTPSLLWTAALSSGLIAGIYFAFSTFIMRAFATLHPSHAVMAMNAINKGILRSLFMPLFFGSTISAVLLIITALINLEANHSGLVLLAGAIYFFGMFACTAVFNVPLNNALAKLDTNNTEAHQVWAHYLKTWTRWNHVRTASALITCVLCSWVIAN